jgi:hypothetical protein
VIRRIALSLAALLTGFTLVWLALLALDISVRLDVLRDPIEAAASQALGRQVRVLGQIEARPTLGPTIVVHDVRITAPDAQQGIDLLQADRVEARLGLIDLLSGTPYITRLLIQDASINLQTREDGSRNWRTADNRAAVDLAPSLRPPATRTLAILQRELKVLSLHDIVLTYRDDRTSQHYQIKLDEVSGSAMPGQPLDLLIRGGIRQKTWVAHLSGGNLSELLTSPVNWPLQITMDRGGARLVLNGALDASQPDQGTALNFELHGELPTAVGGTVMRGRLAASNSGLELTVMEARFGLSTLQGRLSARLDASRPRISADLQIPALDAALLSGTGPTPHHTAGGSPQGRLADIPEWLEAVDLDAAIAVREFIHSPLDIRNVNVKLTIRDGGLSAPLNALIAEVPFHGELSMNRQDGSPAKKLTLEARNVGTGKLIENLTGLEGIQGKFKHIEFHAATSDTAAEELLNGFDIGLNVTGAKLSYGNVAGARPVGFAVDDLALTIPRGKELSVIAHGSLLNKPFAIKFTGGAPDNLLRREEWPVDLSATGGGATLDINGMLAGVPGQSQSRLDLVLTGERLGDLADWFGVSPCAETPYTARGQLILFGNVRRLQFLQVRLGKTQLDGDIDWSVDEQTPLLHALMHFDVMVPDDLDGLMPILNFANERGNKTGIAIDMPVLPQRIDIRNADIKLTSEHLLLKPVEISDISLSSQIRGGKMMRSPFRAHIGATSLTGYLDPSGAATDVVFEIEGNDKVSGSLLENLFSSTVRWAGSAAVVPLQWLLKKELSARDADDCRSRISGTPPSP